MTVKNDRESRKQKEVESKMTKHNPQELQQKYEKWRDLYHQQAEAQKQWLEAEALFDQLTMYYQSPQWMEDHKRDLSVDCSGQEYSILSEDALWNMLTDRDELAKRWIRLGLDAIDKN